MKSEFSDVHSVICDENKSLMYNTALVEVNTSRIKKEIERKSCGNPSELCFVTSNLTKHCILTTCISNIKRNMQYDKLFDEMDE